LSAIAPQNPTLSVPKNCRGADAWNTRIVPAGSVGANTLLSKFDA